MNDVDKAKIKGLQDAVVALLRQKGHVVTTNPVNSYYIGTYEALDEVDNVTIYFNVDVSHGQLMARIDGRNDQRNVTYKERPGKGINIFGIVARIEEVVKLQQEHNRIAKEQEERWQKQREENVKKEKVRKTFVDEFGLDYPHQEILGDPEDFQIRIKHLSSDQLRELLDFARTCGMLKTTHPEDC